MSDDTGCSVDTTGDSVTCAEAATRLETATCTETANTDQDIVLAVDDTAGNHKNVSSHGPISIDDAGIQTSPVGDTLRGKKSRLTKAAIPYIRIVVFTLFIMTLILLCKINIHFLLKSDTFQILAKSSIFCLRFLFRVQNGK